MALDAVGTHALVVAGRALDNIPPGISSMIVLPSRRMRIGGGLERAPAHALALMTRVTARQPVTLQAEALVHPGVNGMLGPIIAPVDKLPFDRFGVFYTRL